MIHLARPCCHLAYSWRRTRSHTVLRLPVHLLAHACTGCFAAPSWCCVATIWCHPCCSKGACTKQSRPSGPCSHPGHPPVPAHLPTSWLPNLRCLKCANVCWASMACSTAPPPSHTAGRSLQAALLDLAVAFFLTSLLPHQHCTSLPYATTTPSNHWTKLPASAPAAAQLARQQPRTCRK